MNTSLISIPGVLPVNFGIFIETLLPIKTNIMKKILFPLLLLVAGFILFESCRKNNGQAKLAIYLTDDPANYDEVNIEIKEVLVNVSNSGGENWKSVAITPGVYNLLDFRNGLDTLLGSIELPAGKVSQIRMVLGSNNSVKEGTKVYELTTPSAQQSGLKFNVQVELQEGVNYKLWIDFDAGRSVVKAGNSGKYILKPVIKTFTEAISGAIKGNVLPGEAKAWIYAINSNNDTVASAKPDSLNGYFLMRGITPSVYKLSIDGSNGYRDSVISYVTVTLGQTTNTGTTILKQ
jgi:hypothetical protein